jgi:perosamine synthetase
VQALVMLQNLKNFLENKIPFDENCFYHLYWIQVKNQTNFRKQMNDVGIQTGIQYKPIHTFLMYKSKTRLSFTEKAGKKLCLYQYTQIFQK